MYSPATGAPSQTARRSYSDSLKKRTLSKSGGFRYQDVAALDAGAKFFAVLTHFATICVLYFRKLGAIVPPLRSSVIS
jgi:hypothetical protein